jgi:hypothetical protein
MTMKGIYMQKNRHSEEAARLTCLPPYAKALGGKPGRSLGVGWRIQKSHII